MISEDQVITLKEAKSVGDYEIELAFDDATTQVIDFHPFLTASLNPLIRKYLDPVEFAKFSIHEGDLQWNDYDLCFPIADLYENSITR